MALLKIDSFLAHADGGPMMLVEAYARREGKVRTDADEHRTPVLVVRVEVIEGSLEKCRCYLILTHHLGYGDTDQLATLLEEVSKLLNAYASAILASDS